MPMLAPSHPGELLQESLNGLEGENKKLTIGEVAICLCTTRKNLSAILNKKQSISTEMAVKLAAAFQNTTAHFWLSAQLNYDLSKADLSAGNLVKVLWSNK